MLGLAAYVIVQAGSLAGKPAPDFEVRGAYGGRVELSSYRGQPLLVVFWTTSCGICRYALPVIDRIGAEYPGLEILAVNIGDAEGAREFVSESRLRLNCAVDESGEVAQRYGVRGVPKLVMIGRDGKVSQVLNGSRNDDALRRWIAGALAD